MRRVLLLTAALCVLASRAAADPIPAAVISDPAPDKANPAHFVPFALRSHGSVIDAILYVPSGAGPHPTVVFLHGLPDADTGVDLAQAIRRAGWNVMIFHYRGSWGNEGTFTFEHCLEDGQAAVDWLRDPKTVAKLPVDPNRIVLVGHSMGGWIAGYTAEHDLHVMALGLISAADFGLNYAAPRADLTEALRSNVTLDEGMRVLGDATPEGLADEIIAKGKDWGLHLRLKNLANRPLLVVTAEDNDRTYDDELAAAVKADGGAKVTTVHFDTNHGYNDHRVALAGAIINWLDTLPGAPH